jgi:diaminohydroxyphosphoribosylaminopyrimidine deaminase / 5-amino-6-(5-phosphoribosylamino)uracil reductase
MNIQDIGGHKVLMDTDAKSFELSDCEEDWLQIRDVLRKNGPLPDRWEALFGTLRAGTKDDIVVIGQIGQSIDGRVATTTGKSHYINGRAGLLHLHRLRAVADAVVIGISTICADDPQLTVRHVRGANPVRVVLDPHARLSRNARILAPNARRIIVTSDEQPACNLQDVDIMRLPATRGCIAPSAILSGLAELGLRRVLVEGGADTISRFLQAGCLDRLHVIVAPLILGAGRPSFAFGAIDHLEDALRPPTCVYRLGDDILFDFDLSNSRVPIWHAKKSI